MNLVTNQATAEAIGLGLMLIPEKVRGLAQADFWTEDPVFTGLHEWEDTGDGRSYRDTPHFAGPPAGLERPTIVIPNPIGPRTGQMLEMLTMVVHELGHAVWYQLDSKGFEIPYFKDVSEYAQSNEFENFAEAFTSVHAPREVRSRYEYDKDVHSFFASLEFV